MAEEQAGAAPAAEIPPAEGVAVRHDPAAPVSSPTPTEPAATPDSTPAAVAPEPSVEPGAPLEAEAPKPPEGAEKAPGAEETPPERPKSLLAEATEAVGEPKPAEPAASPPGTTEPKAEAAEAAHAYETFALPEGVQLDQALLGSYTEALGKYGVTQEGGQALLDMHLAEVQRLSDHARDEQWRVFNETVDRWRTETMADEVLGGAGHQTAMQGVMRAIDRVTGGNEGHRTSLLQALESSGLANHPAVLRAFYNIDRIMAEPMPLPTPEIKPVPDRGGSVRPRSRTGALYPNTNFENGLGR